MSDSERDDAPKQDMFKLPPRENRGARLAKLLARGFGDEVNAQLSELSDGSDYSTTDYTTEASTSTATDSDFSDDEDSDDSDADKKAEREVRRDEHREHADTKKRARKAMLHKNPHRRKRRPQRTLSQKQLMSRALERVAESTAKLEARQRQFLDQEHAVVRTSRGSKASKVAAQKGSAFSSKREFLKKWGSVIIVSFQQLPQRLLQSLSS